MLVASLTLCLSARPAPARTNPLAEGAWVGALAMPDGSAELRARFVGEGGSEVELTMLPEAWHARAAVEREGTALRFVVPTLERGTALFEGRLAERRVEGTAAIDGATGAFHLVQVADDPPAQLAAYVGWYEEAGGDRFLLSFGAYGGLAYVDYDGPSLFAGTRRRLAGSDERDQFARLDGDGRPDQAVVFERDDAGTVVAARWIEADGAERRTPRVADPPFAQELVAFPSGGAEDAPLAGLLLLPRGDGPFPAVAYVHGSGPNTCNDLWDLALCAHLASHGIAALLPDKRGCGRSGGDWRNVGYERLADDALAAVDLLAGRAEVRADAVGVGGLSQGATLAPAVAARGGQRVAFVVSLSGSGVPLVDATTYEVLQMAREAGADEAGVERIRAIQDAAIHWVRERAGWDDYAAAREAGMATPSVARVAAGFPPAPDHWKWAHLRAVGAWDPLAWWRRARQPRLLVWGAEDDLVPVEASDARLRPFFEASDTDWTIRVFEHSGHGLGDPSTGWIRAEALDLVSDWITARTSG